MNELEHFSLRWNNFHSNMSSGFCALLQEDALVDVTLAAEGRILQAHKLVLSVCSPYFKQLFAANPCKHPIVILKDVHHKQLSDLLNFMYQGEVNVRQEELATFLKTAELLQIKGLTEQESEASPSQSHHGLRDERPAASSQKHLLIPKSRQLPMRRIRHQEKPLPVSTLTADVPASPAPSPPPSKRSKPSSPVVVNEENENIDDDRGVSGSEGLENDNSVSVKTEPLADFESKSCRNVLSPQETESIGGEKQETLSQKPAQFQTSTPISSNGGSQKTDTSSIRTPQQRLPPDMNISSASTSSFPLTPSENSTLIPANEQGELFYVTSKRGRLHLLHDGHRYYLHREGVSGTRFWRCLRHRTSGCRAYVSVEDGAKSATKRGKEHNHTPPYERLAHNWIPVPMKLLGRNSHETTFFEPGQGYYDFEDKEQSQPSLVSIPDVQFITENNVINLTLKPVEEK